MASRRRRRLFGADAGFRQRSVPHQGIAESNNARRTRHRSSAADTARRWRRYVRCRCRRSVRWRRSPSRGRAAANCRVEVITPDDSAGHLPTLGVGPVLLLVDDSEAFLDTPVGDALAYLLRAAAAPLAAVVSGRSDDLAVTYRGVASEVRRSRSGLLLQPEPGDGDLLGIRLPRSRPVPVPGRGVLLLDQPQVRALADGADVLYVQVALPSPCAGSDDQ